MTENDGFSIPFLVFKPEFYIKQQKVYSLKQRAKKGHF